MRTCGLICLLLLVFLLTACSQNEALVEYDGRLLTKDEIKALVSSALETEAQEPITVVRFGENEVANELRVYFSDGGSVWHTRSDCGYLTQKNTIYYGTREEAQSAGKDRCCSVCNQDEN